MDQSGVLLAVVGASGGVGASTFSAAVALRAASLGARVALVDTDPVGGGLDVTLAVEDSPGARWRTFAQASGRLDPQGIASSLPEVAGVRLLSHDREDLGLVRPSARSILSVTEALVRGHDLVVADVMRQPCVEREVLLDCADEVLVIASGRVRSVAGAITVVADLRTSHRQQPEVIVARGSERSLGGSRIADTVKVPLAGEWVRDQQLANEMENGNLACLMDSKRGGLGYAAEVVAFLALQRNSSRRALA